MLQINIDLTESAYEFFKTDDEYKDHMKRQLAIKLAEKILDSKLTTFTYIPNNVAMTARLIARIKINEI